MEDVIVKLHEERKAIDARIQAVLALKNEEGLQSAGREVALAYTHLQEAKMWLGQALGAIGTPFPAELADKAEAPVVPVEAQEQPVAETPAAPEVPAEPATPEPVAEAPVVPVEGEQPQA